MSSRLAALPDVTPAQVAAIRAVGRFGESHYAGLDIRGTLEFFVKRYVDQIQAFTPVSAETTIADVGTGFGWLAIAFALTTPARVIAVDMDETRLRAAQKIAEILGARSIDWRAGRLGQLPIADREVDITYCVEVLEHLQRDSEAPDDLGRVTRSCIVLTTPNLWFPKIAHDTQLPFCHWLPLPWRRIYAAVFGREDRENDNLFWSPRKVDKSLVEFKRVSRFLHYDSIESYLATFPFYVPYGHGYSEAAVGPAKKLYYRAAAMLGQASFYVLPNLASVYRRVSDLEHA